MIETLADLIFTASSRTGSATAIRHKSAHLTYDELAAAISAFAAGIMRLGTKKHDRVAVLASKQPETVVAAFGSSLAGGVFVPINPLLRPSQVAYILRDCNVRALVTTAARLRDLRSVLPDCTDLRVVIVTDDGWNACPDVDAEVVGWAAVSASQSDNTGSRVIASDMAAILYTSGSTGKPKGVVLSHANLCIGAASVAHYLENSASDRILAALPFSFDAGLSQLTTGFFAGACVVLHDYLLATDIVRIIEEEKITGLTAVPPLWIQLAEQKWPAASTQSLRFFANTGGKMPRETLAQLRKIFPQAEPFLMYGLTEAFRSSYLPPSEVDRRPDSIGKAIPNVELMVVGNDGTLCKPGEVGELVHRGPLVGLGYWNDPERTAHRFRPAPGQPEGIPTEELAVWTGDSVTMDDDGFLYFVGRMDDMIKTSGYRVSPTEIEEIVHDTGLVSEVVALGLPHKRLGQGIVLVARAKQDGDEPTDALLHKIRPEVPNYMVPLKIRWAEALPRNANGKLDRKQLAGDLVDLFQQEGS